MRSKSLARIGQSDPVFDRRIVKWMEAADHDALAALTAKELHETGSHELLNWLVLALVYEQTNQPEEARAARDRARDLSAPLVTPHQPRDLENPIVVHPSDWLSWRVLSEEKGAHGERAVSHK